MKFEIMTSLLFELLTNKTVSASKAAEKYGVSVRSIYRYFLSLESAGVPLYSVRGNGGGFSIIDTYRLSSTFMTVKEFEKVISTLKGINGGLSDDVLSSAIVKLESTVKNEFDKLRVKSGNLVIDEGSWGNTAGYKEKLKTVSKAADNELCLLVNYHDRNGTVTERTIEPHLVVFKQGLWYTYAYCRLRKQFRFFRLGRIEKITVTGENFMRREIEGGDIPFEKWDTPAPKSRIVFSINKNVLSDVVEWLGIENVKNENGEFTADVNLPVDGGLISKIMSFSGELKVVFPESLQEKIKKAAQEIVAAY